MTHEHLSDEDLSAHLDGAPDAGRPPGDTAEAAAVGPAIEACDVCRPRLAALAGARALVRTPVTPVAPSVRAAAVEAALAEGLAPAPAPSPVVGAVVHRGPGVRRVLLGTAAAVVVVGGVVGVTLGVRHSTTTATSAAASRAAVRPQTHSPTATGASSRPAVPDLGPVPSLAVLRARLTAATPPPSFNSAQKNSDATSALGATSPQSTSKSASASATAGAPAGSDGAGGSIPGSDLRCVSTALQSSGATDIVLVATASYKRTPAVVVVTEATGSTIPSSAGRTAVVLARSDCRLLVATTY